MKKIFLEAVLYMLRQIGSTDINEQLLKVAIHYALCKE
jgi:hypothetical protein